MKLQLEVEFYSENTMWKRLTNLKQMFYIYLLEGDSDMLNNFVLLVDKEKHVKILEYASVFLSGSHKSSRPYALVWHW